jgi:hypothetical protein
MSCYVVAKSALSPVHMYSQLSWLAIQLVKKIIQNSLPIVLDIICNLWYNGDQLVIRQLSGD